MFRYAYQLILIVLACTLIFSCNDSEEPDTAAPIITVKSPIENQRVKGTITIEATGEDRDTELLMQVFLDGNLVDKSSVSVISVQLDTKTLTEGIHTIKITATDKAGNSSEKIFNVDVRNILFKVHISSNYVPEYAQIYFALSQNDGSLIAFNQVENGGTITVPTPSGFNPDSSFVFTQYFYLYMPKSPGNLETLIRNMSVSAGLNAGEFSTPNFGGNPLPVIGTHFLKITEFPTSTYNASLIGSNFSSSYSGALGYNGGVFTVNLDLNKNTSDLYFMLAADTEVPVYNYISSILPGGSTNFSITGLPQMKKAAVTTMDIAGKYDYWVYTGRGFGHVLFSGTGFFDDGKLPIYYPGSIYPEYVFDLRYQLGNNSYVNYIKGATPPLSFQNLDATVSNVNYANRKLTVMSTGTVDVVMVGGDRTNYTGTSFTLDTYSVTFPNGPKNQITIPNIPVELLNLEFTSPTDLVFENAGLFDYLELSGASDYQSKLVFSSDDVFRYDREYIANSFQITATSTGGRLATQKKMKLPKPVEAILRNHFRLEEFRLFH